MEKETIKNIFKFLEDEGEHKAPFKWKLENNIPFSKEELEVDGDLWLYNSEITSLPEGLEVYGHLSLHDSKIESLPEELYVARTLILTNCKNLTSLPKRLKVGDNLILNHTKIKSLPEGLQVGGELTIFNTPLAKLSDETILSMIEPDGYITGEIIKG
jgi:hypothetical protein